MSARLPSNGRFRYPHKLKHVPVRESVVSLTPPSTITIDTSCPHSPFLCTGHIPPLHTSYGGCTQNTTPLPRPYPSQSPPHVRLPLSLPLFPPLLPKRPRAHPSAGGLCCTPHSIAAHPRRPFVRLSEWWRVTTVLLLLAHALLERSLVRDCCGWEHGCLVPLWLPLTLPFRVCSFFPVDPRLARAESGCVLLTGLCASSPTTPADPTAIS